MSATASLFGRVFVAVCASTVKPRLIAAAMAAAVAVASPAAAQAGEFLSGDVPTPVHVAEGGDFGAGPDGGSVAGAAIGAIGSGVLAAALGANKYFTAAAAVVGGIGGASWAERTQSERNRADNSITRPGIPGVVVTAQQQEQEIEPRGLEGAVGLERSLIFPMTVGRTDLPRMRQESVQAYDDLAIQAAAYRLLTQASYARYSAAQENLALYPGNVAASREMILAKRGLDTDIAGLNIAIASYQRATQILRRNYPGNDFGVHQALAVSLAAPAQVRARSVEPDRPIFPFAEAMAMRIRNNEVPHVTMIAPGRSTGEDRMRSAIIGQSGSLNLLQSGRTTRLSPDSTMDALNRVSRMR